MAKTKIKIEKIFRNTVQTKRGQADKFTLMYKNYGFTGWGKGSDYKEGDEVEIEYDENSKCEGDKYTYYNLIEKKKDDILKEILEIVKRIEAKLTEKVKNTLFRLRRRILGMMNLKNMQINKKEILGKFSKDSLILLEKMREFNEALKELSNVLDRVIVSEIELRDKLKELKNLSL